MQRISQNYWSMTTAEKNVIQKELQDHGIARIGGYTITPLNHVFVESQRDVWSFWFKNAVGDRH